jgi:hypothetical protein
MGGIFSPSPSLVGASTSVTGLSGLVPAPAAGKNTRYLASDANFGEVPLLPQYKAANDRIIGAWKPYLSSGNHGTSIRFRQFNLIYVPADGNIDTLRFSTAGSVASACNIHIAIWEVAESGEPSTYVIGGTASTGTTGNTSIGISIASTALKRGFYYISCTADATVSANLVGHGSLFYTCNYIGSSSAGINNSSNFQYSATTYNQTTHETFTFGNAQTTAAVGFEYA